MTFAYLSREKSSISHHIFCFSDVIVMPMHHRHSIKCHIIHNPMTIQFGIRLSPISDPGGGLGPSAFKLACDKMKMLCRVAQQGSTDDDDVSISMPVAIQAYRRTGIPMRVSKAKVCMNLSQVSDGQGHCPMMCECVLLRILSSPHHASTPHF